MDTPNQPGISRRAFVAASGTLFGIGVLGTPLSALSRQPSSDHFESVRKKIREAIEERAAPSIAVAVALGGKIVWQEGFGWADEKKRVPATPHTRYAIASVAKPIVATGIMALVERGQIALDRSANQYLSHHGRITGYAGDASRATVRLLLQHRSGLPPHGQYIYQDDNLNPPSIDETIRCYGILVNPPGERYTYSNLGYGILAHISARLSGQHYADFLANTVFDPLGMADTTLEIEPRLSRDAATTFGPDGRVIPYYVFDEWGSGRVWSTANDMVRFGMFHLGERLADTRPILKDTTIASMVTDNQSTGTEGGFFGTDWFYGLGWGGREKSTYGPKWYGHEGGMPGVSAQLKLFPTERIAVAVLSNGRQDLTYRLIDDIAEVLIPGFTEQRKNDPTRGPRPEQKPFTPTRELLGQWKGEIRTWEGTVPVRMEFQPDGDVHVQVGDALKTLVDGAGLQGDRFSGLCSGTIPTQDAGRYPHQLSFDLTVRERTLSGSVAAVTTGERLRYRLPSWVKLQNDTVDLRA